MELVAGIASVSKDHCNRWEAVHGVGDDTRCSVAILNVGTMNLCSQQIALCINGYMTFAAQLTRRNACLMFLQNADDLLFRKP